MGILDLPAELHQLVAVCLDLKDLSNHRRTCREICKKTFQTYADRVAARRWFASKDSIRTLLSMAKDCRLASRITTFRMDNSNPSAVSQAERWQKSIRDEEFGGLLGEVLNRLTHISRIEIGTGVDVPRLRHGTKTTREFQSSTVMYDLERDFEWHFLNPKLGHSLVEVLRALSVSDRSVTELSVLQSRQQDGGPWYLDCINVWNMPLLPISLQPALASLKYLELGLRYNPEKRRGNSPSLETPNQWIVKFVSMMPALETLHLWSQRIDPVRRLQIDRPCPRWSSGPIRLVGPRPEHYGTLLQQEFCDITLPALTHLQLCNLSVVSDNLINWLKIHGPKMKFLSLRRVSLRKSDNDGGDKHYPTSDGEDQEWPNVLECFKSVASSPISLRLSSLYERNGKVVVFDEENMSICALCQPPWKHDSQSYYEHNCEHITYSTDTGEFPVITQWASLPPHRWSQDSEKWVTITELDEKVWPLHWDQAKAELGEA